MSTCITVQMYGLLRIFCCFISLRQQCYSLQSEDSENRRGVKDMAWCAWSSLSSQSERSALLLITSSQWPQLLITATLNCLMCTHVRAVIHNLLSKIKEYVSGGRDIPELSLNWTPTLKVCFSHGQQSKAGSQGHPTTPARELGRWALLWHQPMDVSQGWAQSGEPGTDTVPGWPGPGDGPRLGQNVKLGVDAAQWGPWPSRAVGSWRLAPPWCHWSRGWHWSPGMAMKWGLGP